MRSPILNLVVGFLGGAALAAALCAHVYAGKAERHVKVDESLRAETKRQQEALQKRLAETQLQLQEEAASLDGCQSVKGVLQVVPGNPEGFTLLYEAGASSATPNAYAYDLANLVRPGLGTALQKFAPQSADAAGVQLRWILPGEVRPKQMPDGARAYYLNPATRQAYALQ